MRSIPPRIRAAVMVCLLFLLTPAARAVGRLADVSIYDRTAGCVLPVYRHQGRNYVVGRAGHEFQVTLRNPSGGDLLTVLSVDGVNAVSGETAAWDQTGYVIDAGRDAGIQGWRKSRQEVAAFYFTRLPDAYASRTGRPANVGVIGVAVFQRKPPPMPYSYEMPGAPGPTANGLARPQTGEARQKERPEAAAGSADASRSDQAERLGTGHGRREYSSVSVTDFERATAAPAEVIAIHYDSYRNLVAMGVIPAAPVALNPFPGAPGFVPDPPR